MFARFEDEYEIYVQAARQLDWEIKTFDEWLKEGDEN
jgi:hypothetical protein